MEEYNAKFLSGLQVKPYNLKSVDILGDYLHLHSEDDVAYLNGFRTIELRDVFRETGIPYMLPHFSLDSHELASSHCVESLLTTATKAVLIKGLYIPVFKKLLKFLKSISLYSIISGPLLRQTKSVFLRVLLPSTFDGRSFIDL